MVNAPIVTTVKKLQLAAKNLGKTGVSKLRKVELEDVILSSREGRKAVYQIEESELAIQAVELVQTKGAFFLPRPIPTMIPKLAGGYDTMEALNAAKQNQHEVFKTNSKAKAKFVGMIQAIKSHLYETGLNKTMRWHENEKGFTLGIVREAKAA